MEDTLGRRGLNVETEGEVEAREGLARPPADRALFEAGALPQSQTDGGESRAHGGRQHHGRGERRAGKMRSSVGVAMTEAEDDLPRCNFG